MPDSEQLQVKEFSWKGKGKEGEMNRGDPMPPLHQAGNLILLTMQVKISYADHAILNRLVDTFRSLARLVSFEAASAHLLAPFAVS